MRIRIAGYQDEQSVHTRAMRLLVASLPDADIAFESNIAERGRKAADLLAMVESGELDLCYFSSSYLSERVPALAALDQPFPSPDREQTRMRLEGDLGATLRRKVAARTGFAALAFWDNGLRHLSNALRPVRTPADCQGLRIRTLPSPLYHATFRALGMQPVSIDVADMVEAIAQGRVDAQENPLTNIQLFGLQRYHRHVTLTAHFHGIALVLANAAAWDGWPADARAAFSAALAQATQAQWRFAAADDVACRQWLEGEGVQIIELDDAARADFARSASAERGPPPTAA